VAIVAMTDKTAPEEKGIMVGTMYVTSGTYLETNLTYFQTFSWSKQVQGAILSSFFWGYTCMQLPGGHLAHRYGAKHLLVFALIVNGVLAMVLPWSARVVCNIYVWQYTKRLSHFKIGYKLRFFLAFYKC